MAAVGTAVPLHALDLKVDVNDRDNNTPANTEGGFTAMSMSASPAGAQNGAISITLGAQTVTLTSSLPGVATANYDDRKRDAPVNQDTFNQQTLLQDFIFAVNNAANPTEGIDVEIAGLVAGKDYDITLWSFDPGSGGTRISDWSANGVLEKEDYTFDGRVAPTTNEEYQINFTSTADAAGKILIQGRRDVNSVDGNGAASHGVFLNALWLRDSFVDSDGDSMPDGWETTYGLQVGVNDAAGDADSDGLSNLGEYNAGTAPNDNDSDDDTLMDGKETRTGVWNGTNDTGTNPLDADSDDDGLDDARENPDLPYTGPAQPGTDPNKADSDGDFFTDGDELLLLTNPDDIAEHPVSTGTLAIDFGEDDTPVAPAAVPTPVLTNWSGLDGLTGWTDTFTTPDYPAGITVAVTPVGSVTLDDRDRGAANGGGIYLDLYRDFLFANASGDQGDGMDVTITGLRPDTTYPIVLIIFDRSSAGRSQWLANDAGGDFVFKAGDTFAGATDPGATSLAHHSVRFLFTTDNAGRIVIEGLAAEDATATHNVFLNGFLIHQPVQPIDITAVTRDAAAGSVTITWNSVPRAPYQVEFSTDLATWSPASATIPGNSTPGALTTTTTVSIPSPAPSRAFLRVRRTDL